MSEATHKQIAYCRRLFRKVKMYYRCLKSDEELRDEVFKRTGFDLDNLSDNEARSIIGKLKPEIAQQRKL